MSLEKVAISNMWEIAAMVELLEQKGLCTKQDLYDIIAELRKKHPRARLPETVFPSPYLMTQTEEKVIDDILAVLNQNGLDSKQSLDLLEHLGRIIEMGQEWHEERHSERRTERRTWCSLTPRNGPCGSVSEYCSSGYCLSFS